MYYLINEHNLTWDGHVFSEKFPVLFDDREDAEFKRVELAFFFGISGVRVDKLPNNFRV